MSEKFDSRKDSHSTKLEQRPQIFTRLNFIEGCGSKLSGLHPFDVKNRLKIEGRLRVHEVPILEIIL